jgi:hypothetical protein
MVIGGMGLLGLALLGLKARRVPVHAAPDAIATHIAQPTCDAQPSAEEVAEVSAAQRQTAPDVTAAALATLEPNMAAATPLAELMIDLDDLELGLDQGEEADGLGSVGTAEAVVEGASSVNRTVSPSRPNAASTSRKAGEASPSNTC